MSKNAIVVLALLLGTVTDLSYGDIAPSEDLQTKFLNMFVAVDEKAWSEKLELIDKAAMLLKEESYERRAVYLEQLVYFSAKEESFETNHETPFAVGRLVKKAEFSGKEILTASTSHWIGADNELRKAIQEWVQVATGLDSDPADESFPNLMRSRDIHGNIPEGLVAYLFDWMPARAVLAFARLQGANDEAIEGLRTDVKTLPRLHFGNYSTRDVEHKRNAQKELLNLLSHDENWWVRFYALHIACAVKEIRPPEILERMAKDDHEYVKQRAIRTLEAEAPKGTSKQGENKE